MACERGTALLLSAVLALGACRPGRGGAVPGHTAPSERGPDEAPAAEAAAEAGGPDAPAPESDVVHAAALPWHGARAVGNQALEPEALLAALASATLVCVGEDHDDPHHHFARLAVLSGLVRRAQSSGREVGVGLEMLDASAQPALDRLVGGQLELGALPGEVGWKKRWGFDFELVRPLLGLAVERGLAVRALNAPPELARAVAQGGLDALSAADRKALPDLDLSDAEHREAFDAALAAHPHGGDPERLYEAQVLWDETMAASAAAWLMERSPRRQLVVAAGRQHCHERAIPARVARRTGQRALAVIPMVVQGDEGVTVPEGFDYAVVLRAGG